MADVVQMADGVNREVVLAVSFWERGRGSVLADWGAGAARELAGPVANRAAGRRMGRIPDAAAHIGRLGNHRPVRHRLHESA